MSKRAFGRRVLYTSFLVLALTSFPRSHASEPTDKKTPPTRPRIMAVQGETATIGCQLPEDYADPFNEVEIDLVFTHEKGGQWCVPAYWAGGRRWYVRFAPPLTGTYGMRWQFRGLKNGKRDEGEAELVAAPNNGLDPLIAHGPLQVSPCRRHFVHADGKPFFWLGDTQWMSLCGRMSDAEFEQLASDREAKGFTVVQIVAGLYPDEPPFDPRARNAGGWAWEKDYARINPAFFDHADRRIRCLAKHHLVPCIVGSWGYHLPPMGVERMKKHWRYMIARWGSLPVVWCLAGEVGMPYYLSKRPDEERQRQLDGWREVAKYVRKIDPYHRPLTVHPSHSGREEFQDDSLLDFDMLQTGHGGWKSAASTIAYVSSHYSKTPVMPVVVGEVSYEGLMAGNWPDVQRFMFWTSLLNGAGGFTYGAGGIWQMNTRSQPHGPSPHGGTYEDTPWDVAAQFPGAQQLGLAKKLLENYPWWEMKPHPEWIHPSGPTLLEEHADWYRPMSRWTASQEAHLLPYAAGAPKKFRLVYIPKRDFSWETPVMRHLESDVQYQAYFFDPITGGRRPLGQLPAQATTWQPPRVPLCQDWLLVLECVASN